MDYFQDATTQRFTFVSHASGVSETTFAVMRFKGLEAISTPYEFEIMLVSGDPDLDMAAILRSQAVFTIHRDAGDDVTYNGILAEFDQLHAYNEHYFYRAKLVPKIWWLMQTQHNQVFLDKTVPEIIEGALVDGGMDSLDYDLAGLEGTYNPVDYVCQYGESHFNFVSRWLEREGVYYYFYHDSEGDKLVLSDSSFSHEPFQQGADLVYSPKTGMEQGHLDEIIINFTCRQKQLPNRIVLKDHNPERPSLEMAVRADVDPDGRGESFLYGEHYNTPEEGERLIAFRVDELLCQKQAFHGDSTVPFLTPGFKFNMNEHYRSAFNQEYMVTSVTHEGDQTNLLKTSVIGSLSEDAEINIYSNSFTAIPADRQYRHPRTADRPRISGTLHGKIDGEQDSPYAQLDEQGRYKVKLPFDINDEHIDGKASARVRMMQPYAGEGKGMQFPLTKGTEVLLTFIDGNPDRPVIAGAVSTETAPSPVNADNQSESVIRSAGNNRIRMEDKSGKERIVLQSPTSGTWLRVGATNDPMTLKGESPELHMNDTVWDDFGANTIDLDTERPTSTVINATWLRLETEVDQKDPEPKNYLGESLPEGRYIARYVDGSDTLSRTVLSFDLEDEAHEFYKELGAPGIRWATSGSYWYEARGRVGSYQTGYPNYAESDAKDHDGRKYVDTLLTSFTGAKPLYNPQELRDFATGEPVSLLSVMKQGSVEVSSLDTVTTQEGNIYDFGGYWNYNLGNSYEEAFINQCAELNQTYASEWPASDKQANSNVQATATLGIAAGVGSGVLWTAIGAGAGSAVAANAASVGGAIAAGVFAAGIPALAVGLSQVKTDGLEAEFFSNNIGDLASAGGPGSPNEVEIQAKQVGSSFDDDDKTQNFKTLSTSGKKMNSTTTWMSKTFGDSYSFNRGNTIEVNHGHTESHVRGDEYEYIYGGIRESTKYNGAGIKTAWEKSGGGESQESHWDPNTGLLSSYEYKHKGWFTFALSCPSLPKVNIAVGTSLLDVNIGAFAGNSINAQLAASLAINIKATAGLSIDMECSMGGKLLMDETTKGFEFQTVGLKAKKEADVLAEKKNLIMEQMALRISNMQMELHKTSGVSMKSSPILIDTSNVKFF